MTAFTLIELLLVVAINAVLLGLLTSAVMMAREAGNRSVCMANLRQLALAAAGYQDHNGCLPPNYHEDPSRTDGSHNLYYGPVLPLLPFLEQDASYRNFSFLYYDSPFPDPQAIGWPNASAGAFTWEQHTWDHNPFNLPPAQSGAYVAPPDPLTCPNPSGRTNVVGQSWGSEGNFRVFNCPSHPAEFVERDQGRAIVMATWGKPTIDMPRGNPFANDPTLITLCRDDPPGAGCERTVGTHFPATYVVGRSDYVAVVGSYNTASSEPRMTEPLSIKYRSLFSYPVRPSLANVPDGTSNTLLFSEFCGRYVSQQASPEVSPQLNGWYTASWATNGFSVAFGTCPDPNNAVLARPDGETLPCDYGQTSGAGLGSGATLGGWHVGRFNVAFADGSVRSLRLGLDRTVLFALAGYNDGDPVTASDY